ncbi:MAG TPA: DUF3822 family protein [Candidatus Coprenecus pullistercoris]|nr:DUF3822 family protein [Candidatus Coprenecus pullistercoris]
MHNQQHRITIQLDLDGYSFTIYDRNGRRVSEERHECRSGVSAEDLRPVLEQRPASLSIYVPTWKYVLVPQSHFAAEDIRSYLDAVRETGPDDKVLMHELPSRKAVLIFAVDEGLMDGVSALCPDAVFYPLSYVLIDRMSSMEDNNRLVAAFSGGMLHVAAAERDRLLFANTFPVSDTVTAEYFIFSVAKEVLFNMEHTRLYIFGSVPCDMEKSLRRYFSDIKYLQ